MMANNEEEMDAEQVDNNAEEGMDNAEEADNDAEEETDNADQVDNDTEEGMNNNAEQADNDTEEGTNNAEQTDNNDEQIPVDACWIIQLVKKTVATWAADFAKLLSIPALLYFFTSSIREFVVHFLIFYCCGVPIPLEVTLCFAATSK